MKLQNNFTTDTRLLFLDVYYCMDCGRSDRGLELHHIGGRRSNSAYNAIVLCRECHSHCGHSEQEEKKYFEITLRFLTRNAYRPTKRDIEFIHSYKRLRDVVFGDSRPDTKQEE